MSRFGQTLGLVALLAGAPALAEDDTGYSAMSRTEINALVQNRTVILNDNNFQREVLDYDGAVLILFDSTCNRTEEADIPARNMEDVYLQLRDKFDDTKVNDLDLKFAYIDGCNREAGVTVRNLGVKSVTTIMYLDGKEIDRMVGGPKTEQGIGPTYRNMSNTWIPWNLFGAQDEDCNSGCTYLFEGQYQLHEVRK